MCVRFYVLNHSKYRFPFHAVYIGIMNGIRKPTFHAARYNRVKYLGSDVRSRPLQSAPMDFFCPETVVILHREPTRLRKPQRRIFETLVRDSPARIFVVARQQRAVPLYAEKFFGIQRYSSLASSEAKNPRRKNFRKIYAKPPLRLPRVGRFPLQYYNHAGAKTNPRYGLERSGADIGTEVFHPVVSCSMKGRFSYCVHYPDINCMK